jgi:very-short-patch-repair endonuclease
MKGNEYQKQKIPLQLEGVARSDGVVAPELETHKLSQLPYNPALKQRARELRKAGNLSEVLFWNVVKNKQLNGQDFDRQRVIGNYIVDFYCHEYSLVVEIDGSSHNDKQAYDQARDEYLEALGLKVLHVQDVDVKQNLAGVVALVRQQLNARHTARSLCVVNSQSTTPSLRATPSKEGE